MKLRLQQINLIGSLVGELVDTIPREWGGIVFYYEVKVAAGKVVDSLFASSCLVDGCWDRAPDDFCVGASVAASSAMTAVYEESVASGDEWLGLRLVIFRDLRFKADFFRDVGPVLSGARGSLGAILAEGESSFGSPPAPGQ